MDMVTTIATEITILTGITTLVLEVLNIELTQPFELVILVVKEALGIGAEAAEIVPDLRVHI